MRLLKVLREEVADDFEEAEAATSLRKRPAICSAKPTCPGWGRHVRCSRSSVRNSLGPSRSMAKGLLAPLEVDVADADTEPPLLLLRRGVLLPLSSMSRLNSSAEVEVAIDLRRLASRGIGGGIIPIPCCCCSCCLCRCCWSRWARKAACIWPRVGPGPTPPKEDGIDDLRDGRFRANDGGRVIASLLVSGAAFVVAAATAATAAVTEAEMTLPPFRNRLRRLGCCCCCCCAAAAFSARSKNDPYEFGWASTDCRSVGSVAVFLLMSSIPATSSYSSSSMANPLATTTASGCQAIIKSLEIGQARQGICEVARKTRENNRWLSARSPSVNDRSFKRPATPSPTK